MVSLLTLHGRSGNGVDMLLLQKDERSIIYAQLTTYHTNSPNKDSNFSAYLGADALVGVTSNQLKAKKNCYFSQILLLEYPDLLLLE